MKKVLTIAGSDSGGGAGIQADIKTFSAFKLHGMSVITALTAQNTLGVQKILVVTPEFVQAQISSIMEDIGVDSIKTGMLVNLEIVDVVINAIKKYKIPNIVVDTVMTAKGGRELLSHTAHKLLITELIPLATVVTPNLCEAEIILNTKIETFDDMKLAAKNIKKLGCQWVVLKGGHFQNKDKSNDVAYNGKDYFFLDANRFNTKNTHGTGCTFSAAIAAGLALGHTPLNAIKIAKKFITIAILHSFAIGSGHGLTNHFKEFN